MQVVHCAVIGNDGLVYVCDRQADRIRVFDKMGNFKIISGSREATAFPIIGAPHNGLAFLPAASRNTCTWTTEAMSKSKFLTMLAKKSSQASGVLVTRSVNLLMATLWQ
jgi:hypothetical protein